MSAKKEIDLPNKEDNVESGQTYIVEEDTTASLLGNSKNTIISANITSPQSNKKIREQFEKDLSAESQRKLPQYISAQPVRKLILHNPVASINPLEDSSPNGTNLPDTVKKSDTIPSTETKEPDNATDSDLPKALLQAKPNDISVLTEDMQALTIDNSKIPTNRVEVTVSTELKKKKLMHNEQVGADISPLANEEHFITNSKTTITNKTTNSSKYKAKGDSNPVERTFLKLSHSKETLALISSPYLQKQIITNLKRKRSLFK